MRVQPVLGDCRTTGSFTGSVHSEVETLDDVVRYSRARRLPCSAAPAPGRGSPASRRDVEAVLASLLPQLCPL